MGDRQESHCFNIVKRKNDYALLDYSIPIVSYKEDGSLDVNFLTNGTPSFKEYYVVDENNNIVQSLEDYDMKIKKEISSNMKL